MPRLSTLGSLVCVVPLAQHAKANTDMAQLRMLPRRLTLLVASIFRFELLQSTNRANRLTFRINGILIYHHTRNLFATNDYIELFFPRQKRPSVPLSICRSWTVLDVCRAEMKPLSLGPFLARTFNGSVPHIIDRKSVV